MIDIIVPKEDDINYQAKKQEAIEFLDWLFNNDFELKPQYFEAIATTYVEDTYQEVNADGKKS